MAGASARQWPFVGRRGELEQIGDALEDEGCAAVLIAGPSGVGKSRLAAEALELFRGRGHAGTHVLASGNASAVPLSALLPILPSDPGTENPRRLFEGAAQLVRDRTAGGGGRLVLVVDDIDLLDVTSLALLAYLLAHSPVFLIATQRTGTSVPDMLEALWRGGRALRLTLERLQRLGVETLLHLALGAPVTAAAAQALWEASVGNLLHLRELVLAACAEGALDGREGAWRLVGRLSATGGVRALVGERLERLSPAERAVLELLALCQPIGLSDLLQVAAEEVLAELERTGLLVVQLNRRRQEVSLAHPLHAEVLRETMPRLTARRLLLAQVERVRAHGARRGGDPLLVASWLLDATGECDPELLIRAAGLAHFGHDMDRTVRLAGAALASGPQVRASLLLGAALGESGRGAEAVACLREAFEAADAAEAGPVAQVLAINLYYGTGDPEGALDCLRRAAARRAPGRAPELAAAQATYLSMSGRTTEAAALLDAELPDGWEAFTAPGGAASAQGAPIGEGAAGSAVTRVHVLRAGARVLLDSGRFTEAAQVAERGFEEHLATHERSTLHHPAGSLLAWVNAELELGDLARAAALVERGQAMALSDGADSLTPWYSWQSGRIALVAGRPATAERHFLEAAAQARAATDPTPDLLAQAGLVLARAARRDVEGVAAPLRRLEELARRLPLRHADIDRARAWALLPAGGAGQARELLLASAGEYGAHGHRAHTVSLLHEALRLGDRGAAATLATAAGAVDGPAAAARAAHARAVLDRDPEALTAAAEAFEGLGAELLAAEALLGAAQLWRDRGGQRAAAAADVRAAALAARCEGALPPELLDWHTTSPLSAREREVSLLVAEGLSSRQIAERLFLSVRTVDNHLQNIYAKLGVANRGELAATVAVPGRATGAEGASR
ncbi:helix-turn-helix transcriptional regulator [Streptacidiphilus rugosus]|uniref:helix-turn-helix transcriptional regulator n=1 Tax=Streptacidiphilus rugosus TaxID=405783 RepID=UPI0018DBC3D0|nr:LuxR family transcriptional regulator [Streptacidiphilus rugosus]